MEDKAPEAKRSGKQSQHHAIRTLIQLGLISEIIHLVGRFVAAL